MKGDLLKHWKDQGDLLNTGFIQHGRVCRKRCGISTPGIPEERSSGQQGLQRARAGRRLAGQTRPRQTMTGQHQATPWNSLESKHLFHTRTWKAQGSTSFSPTQEADYEKPQRPAGLILEIRICLLSSRAFQLCDSTSTTLCEG